MTEIPDAVDGWLDGLTAAELDDVARLLRRRAEDKRRRELRIAENTTETTQSQSLDVQGDHFPRRPGESDADEEADQRQRVLVLAVASGQWHHNPSIQVARQPRLAVSCSLVK